MNNKIQEKVSQIREKINTSKINLESNKKELEGVQVVYTGLGLLEVFEKTVSAMGKRLADGLIQVFAKEVKETNHELIKKVDEMVKQDAATLTKIRDIKLPEKIKVSNLNEIDIPEVVFPKQMDVKVVGEAGVRIEEPSQTLFERDRIGKIREITQIYDTFTLVTTFRRDLSGKIERINTIRKDY